MACEGGGWGVEGMGVVLGLGGRGRQSGDDGWMVSRV